MKAFVQLFKSLDESNKTTVKVEALATFFKIASDTDKVWAIALLSHKRPKRPVSTKLLRIWCAETAGIPLWLFEESYHIVGDLAETIALLVKQNNVSKRSLTQWVEIIKGMHAETEASKRKTIINAWESLSKTECFLFNKIITGGFRVGVSQKIMVKGLSKATGLDENLLAFQITGNWDPASTDFHQLIYGRQEAFDTSKPYPFFLAHALEKPIEKLGSPDDWQVEYKWDGIRGQVIKRDGKCFIWSRGEELVTDKYPEVCEAAQSLPDGLVLDGELLAWKEGKPLNFHHMQKRIGRKSIGSKLLKDVPVVLMSYDLLEYQGKDIRNEPLKTRRKLLQDVLTKVEHPSIMLSPTVSFQNWSELNKEDAKVQMAEGFMIKKSDASYEVGRKKGSWWKWKIDPYTVDAVLTYAMRGHGRRSNLFTDYTFGLWQNGELVTFAKAYSGLTDAEFRKVDQFVKKNTTDRFGPVRQVAPKLVFEIAFEGIARSSRHKSGYAVRFPRIHRWRTDKSPNEANQLKDLEDLII